MLSLLIFGLALLAAVLISELAHRSVISTAVLFLLAGFAVGEGAGGFIVLRPDSPVVSHLAEFALVAVLFSDAMKAGWRDLASAWRLPGRALLLGLPLTLVLTALLARFLVGLGWIESFLIGAVLSPTDPVFAAAIVGRSTISRRLRHLLNVESGLNDGLALPIVLGLLALLLAGEDSMLTHLGELGLGAVLGVAIPWVAVRIERLPAFAVAEAYEPFFAFAIGIVVFALASLTHANEFIAAFTAGVTLATMQPRLRDGFQQFGERVAELFKLAALLVFGALMSPQFLAEIPLAGYVFALLALVVPRPAALWFALPTREMGWRDKLVAMWFGPKGFASVVYGILVLKSGIAAADQLFHLIALVVAASIIAHSSTDVAIAGWLKRADERNRASPSV